MARAVSLSMAAGVLALAILTGGVVAAVTILQDLPGRIDAILTNCPSCFPVEGRVADEPLIDRILWRWLRHVLLSDGSAIDDDRSIFEKRCLLCRRYQGARAHLRIGGLLLSRMWWRTCALLAVNVSITSKPGNFVERAKEGSVWPSQRHGSSENWRFLWEALFDVWNELSLYQNRYDVLSVDVTERDAIRDEIIIPPPAIEFGELDLRWKSWDKPIVDVRASDVTVNFVLDAVPSDKFKVPLPVVYVGNTPLDEVLDMIPPPPDAEGLYPRVGAINVTGVSFGVWVPSDTEIGADQDDFFAGGFRPQGMRLLARVNLPDKLFEPLLLSTSGPSGIDQLHFNDVLETALQTAVRRHVLGEEKIKHSLDKAVDIADFLKHAIGHKLGESSELIDSFMSEGSAALQTVWEELRKDWEMRRSAFNGTVKGMEEILEPFRDSILCHWDRLEKYLDGLALSVRELRERRVSLPELIDEWKHGWKALQDKWKNDLVRSSSFVNQFVQELSQKIGTNRSQN